MRQINFKIIIKITTLVFLSAFVPVSIYFYVLSSPLDDIMLVLSIVLAMVEAFLILPFVFLVLLVIPKKYILFKKGILMFVTSCILFWLLFLFCGVHSIEKNHEDYENNLIDSHSVIINKLNDYKNSNGHYPKNLKDINIVQSNSDHYSYDTCNNDQDFSFSFQADAKKEFYYFYFSPNVNSQCNQYYAKSIDTVKMKDNWLKYIDYD